MKTFKDQSGREFTVRVNCATLKRVRDVLGVNLSLVSDIIEISGKLQVDDLFVAQVAKELAVPDAPPDFLEKMHGDSITQASDAIQEALPDFFRNPSRRAAAKRVIELAREVASPLISGKLPTNSPESAESIPTPIPSES